MNLLAVHKVELPPCISINVEYHTCGSHQLVATAEIFESDRERYVQALRDLADHLEAAS